MEPTYTRAIFEAMLATVRDAIIVMGNRGEVVFWNAAAERIFGYTRAETMGRNLHELVAPARNFDAHQRGFAEFQKSGAGAAIDRTLELIARRKDGTEFPVELSLSATRLESGWHAVGVARDISRRKRNQSELLLLKTALEAAANAIVILDRRGTVVWVNPAFTLLTGYSASEVIGQNPRVLKSGEHSTAFYRSLWDTVLAGNVWHGEMVNRRKDGSLYTEQMTITPVRDESGFVTHFIAVKIDASRDRQLDEAHRRREEAERHNQALQEAVRAHQQIIGVVGHELRSPLATLRAIAEIMLMEQGWSATEKDEMMKSMHEEILRMSRMITDFLDVATLNSGRARWHWETFSVGAVAEEAIAAIRAAQAGSAVELAATVDPPDVQMAGDREAIRRLLVNFLTNASKHTTQGSITVSVSEAAVADGRWIELRVADTGTGIKATAINHLGEAFALNSGIVGEGNTNGTGLGLSICRSIAAAHGGLIAVRSAPGKGTTVTTRLRGDLDAPMDTRDGAAIHVEVAQ